MGKSRVVKREVMRMEDPQDRGWWIRETSDRGGKARFGFLKSSRTKKPWASEKEARAVLERLEALVPCPAPSLSHKELEKTLQKAESSLLQPEKSKARGLRR